MRMKFRAPTNDAAQEPRLYKLPADRFRCELASDGKEWHVYDSAPGGAPHVEELEYPFLTGKEHERGFRSNLTGDAAKDASDNRIASDPNRSMSARLAAVGRMNERFHKRG